jgi:DNA-binding transcriptional MerR regulator
VQVPDKLYFKIGEVARIAGVKPYVVRYWESEFGALRPEKSSTGQRLYRRQDVQKLLDIKRLLHQEGYTIAGARKRLREEAGEVEATPAVDAAWIERVRREVRELMAIVDADGRDEEAT